MAISLTFYLFADVWLTLGKSSHFQEIASWGSPSPTLLWKKFQNNAWLMFVMVGLPPNVLIMDAPLTFLNLCFFNYKVAIS